MELNETDTFLKEVDKTAISIVVKAPSPTGEREIGIGDLGLIKNEFIQYKKLLELYESGLQTLKTRITVLTKELADKRSYNPIETLKYRMKSFESTIDKLQKKNVEISVASMKENVFDIAGIRIICPFINDVYDIFELLNQQSDLGFVRVRDYISKPKESGYRSLHAIVTVPVYLSTGQELVPVEIQIRTLAMDFWASIEHHLQYKSDESSITDEERTLALKDCAETISDIDKRMQLLTGTAIYTL